MLNIKIKDLIIKDIDEIKSIQIFIGEKCYSIINYEKREDFKIDMVKDDVILKYKDKDIIKYNKSTSKFRVYKV